MNKFLLLGISACFFCTNALADTDPATRSAELLSECVKAVQFMDVPNDNPDAVDMIYANRCTHYISGVRDAFTVAGKACVPTNVSAGQLARLVVKYGNAHPELLAKHKMTLALFTIVRNYPCSSAG